MTLFFRAVKVVLCALLGRKLGLLDVSRVKMRCWLNDLDPYLHMNNGRYLTIMDLGRTDLVIRNGVLRLCLKNRWKPVLAGAVVRYKKSIGPLAKFTMQTKLLGIDGASMFMEQRIFHRGKEATVAHLRLVFLAGDKKLPVLTLLRAAGLEGDPPIPPPEVAAWQKWENEATRSNGSQG